jgi:hypothetical protein
MKTNFTLEQLATRVGNGVKIEVGYTNGRDKPFDAPSKEAAIDCIAGGNASDIQGIIDTITPLRDQAALEKVTYDRALNALWNSLKYTYSRHQLTGYNGKFDRFTERAYHTRKEDHQHNDDPCLAVAQSMVPASADGSCVGRGRSRDPYAGWQAACLCEPEVPCKNRQESECKVGF